MAYASAYSMTYPTDLSDAEFGHIEEHLPAANRRGRPKIHTPPEILNAVFFFYVTNSGCPWRLLPRDFPAVAQRLPLVSSLAYRRYVGAGNEEPGQKRRVSYALALRG